MPPSTTDDDQGRRRRVLLLLERLHRHKDAAYGDAWRKRGEVIAIFANMARKYDRLLVAFDEERPAATEPLADTAADLLVYTGKYLTWIADEHPNDFAKAGLPLSVAEVTAARGPDALAVVLKTLADETSMPEPSRLRDAWAAVDGSFGKLERALMAQATPGAPADALLDYRAKAALAWRLAAELSWLLLRLEAEEPATMNKLRAEVAEMDEAGGR